MRQNRFKTICFSYCFHREIPWKFKHGRYVFNPVIFLKILNDYGTQMFSDKVFLKKLMVFLSCLIFIGCSEPDLKIVKKPYSSYSNDSFCVVDPVEVEGGSVKIMFVVDISESNRNTDSDGSKRANSIDKLVRELEQKNKSYEYGVIRFNDQTDALITYPENEMARFTDDAREVYDATNIIRGNPHGGNTNYGPALLSVQQAIDFDIEQAPSERSAYVVLFISDGVPTDGAPTTWVSSLMTVNARRDIILSTAYYGNVGNRAIDLLQGMAEEGDGNFANFENNENWDLEDLIHAGPNVIPWNLKEFLVYNLNAGFCLDGRVDVDSDADGMCDRDELEMNRIYATELAAEGKSFDPANRFSFGDGYGDFFHWLRFKYPGKRLPRCMDRSDEDFDLLTVCEENEIENQMEEENVLRGDPESFDTDRDGIIDGIETFVYFGSQNTRGATRYTAALDPENLEDNPDGEESVLVQIKQHRNPWFRDTGLNPAYDTTITPYQSAKNDCYNFTQSSLPIYETLEVKEGNTLPGLEHGAGENSVMVYYIQVLQSQPSRQGILKHSVQKLSGNTGLKVRDGMFSEYIPPSMEL